MDASDNAISDNESSSGLFIMVAVTQLSVFNCKFETYVYVFTTSKVTFLQNYFLH